MNSRKLDRLGQLVIFLALQFVLLLAIGVVSYKVAYSGWGCFGLVAAGFLVFLPMFLSSGEK